jgi:O-antigen/teichoic acid export membrane protein
VKIFSVLLGVTGLGIISQLINFQNLILFIVPIGIPLGLTRYISENEKKDSELTNIIFLNSLRVLVISSLIFTVIISLFSVFISDFLFDNAKYYLFVLILALSIPFSILTSFLDAYLRGLKNINLLVKILITSTIISFVLTVIFVFFFKLEGVVIGLLVGNFFSMLVYFVGMKKKYLIPKLNIFAKFNKEIIGNIIKIGFASLTIGAVSQLVLLLIRTITINKLGVYGNGIYQSVLGISLNYFGFIYLTLNIYSFPKISGLKLNSEVIDEININFRYILFLMIPLVALIFVFREYVIALLFTKDFSSSESLYKYQFFGDLFKAFSWVIGLWLIPKLKLFLWVSLDLILSVNFLMIYALLLNFYSNGLDSLAIAYLLSNGIHFVLNFIVARKYLKFKFQSKNLSAAVTGLVLLTFIVAFSEYNVMFGYFLIIPALFLWFFYVMKKSEWIFIKDNFQKYVVKKFVS